METWLITNLDEACNEPILTWESVEEEAAEKVMCLRQFCLVSCSIKYHFKYRVQIPRILNYILKVVTIIPYLTKFLSQSIGMVHDGMVCSGGGCHPRTMKCLSAYGLIPSGDTVALG